MAKRTFLGGREASCVNLSLIVAAVVGGRFSLVFKHFHVCEGSECEKYASEAPECEKCVLLSAEITCAVVFGGLQVLKSLVP